MFPVGFKLWSNLLACLTRAGFWGPRELQEWGLVWVCGTRALTGGRKERERTADINPRLVETVCERHLGFLWLLDTSGKGKCWWQICQIGFSLKSIKLLSSKRDFLPAAIQLASREKRAIRFRCQQCQFNVRGKDLPMCQSRAISPYCHTSGQSRSERGQCFCPSLLWKISSTSADWRVLLVSDTVVLAWFPQACGEIWPNLLPCPGSSTGSRQGNSIGNDVHPLPHCKGAIQWPVPSLHPCVFTAGTVQLLSWGSKICFWPMLLSSFNFQMALSVWEGWLGELRITAWTSELQERLKICCPVDSEQMSSMLKMKRRAL